MNTLQIVESGDHSAQILFAEKEFKVKSRAVAYVSDKVEFKRGMLFDNFLTVEAKGLAYVNISSPSVLNIFRGVTLPDGIEVEEAKLLAYRGFKLTKSLKNFGFVSLEKTKSQDSSKLAHENRSTITRVDDSIGSLIISYEDSSDDSFFVIESDHKLIMKNLADEETIKVKKTSVVMKNVQGKELQTMVTFDLLSFVEFKGPGVLFLDPIKGSWFNTKQVDFTTARKLIVVLIAGISCLAILNFLTFLVIKD